MEKKIKSILEKSTGADVDFDLLYPNHSKFGHYSTNLAMKIAKNSSKSLMDIAKRISAEVEKNSPAGFFEKVEVAKPGFINLWLSSSALSKEFRLMLDKDDLCVPKKSRKKEKIQVEFVSANPTGPLTLANGRGGFLGDVISNVLLCRGYDVEKEYYINDAGNQILTLGKSILALAGKIAFEDYFYKGGYLNSWIKNNKNFVLKHKDPLVVGRKAAGCFLSEIKKTLANSGIKFDKWISEEKDIRRKGYVDKVVSIFKRKKLVYEKDGAVWLNTTDFGDDKDRVIITKSGEPTYFLADSGHCLQIKERGFKRKILILGPDHYGYVKRIKAVAKILKIKNFDVVITQAIRVIKNNELFKMSKRKGNFLTFDSLIDDIGTDAARFFMLMFSPNTHMDLDINLAKEKSVKNPVYYVQYAYVRAVNILKKSHITKPNISYRKLSKLLNTEADKKLMLELLKFSDILDKISNTYEVHKLINYAKNLASAFHNFYETERVIVKEKDVSNARIMLVKGSIIVFGKLFDIIGISKPKKM